MDATTETQSQQAPTGNKSGRGLLFGVVGCAVMSIILLTAVYLLVSPQLRITKGNIYITQAFLTTGVDTQGNLLPSVDKFLPEQPRIYCYVAVTAPKPISIGIRWYYEDKLFFNYAEVVDKNQMFFIQPLPGEKFKEGKYRVEIYLVDEAIRTLNFTVGN